MSLLSAKLSGYDRLLSMQELASVLNVSYNTVYGMVDAHAIPFQKFGKATYRFDPTVIADWLVNRYNTLSEDRINEFLRQRGIDVPSDVVVLIWQELSKLQCEERPSHSS